MRDLARRHAGRVTLGTLNVDEHPAQRGALRRANAPTLILFRDGAPVERVVGAVKAERLERAMTPHLTSG